MGESHVIARTGLEPITVPSLVKDLVRLGVQPGMTLMVHSAISRLGWVCGGPPAVVLALQKVLGSSGTLVMPTHTNHLSDPKRWQNPPVPENWWQTIRETMPAYQPDITPTREMGTIVDCFRSQRGVRRGSHPHYSFAAWGAHAEVVAVPNQPLPFGLGDDSTLGRMYDLAGWVLLVGVGHDSNTSLHLSEYRVDYPTKETKLVGAPVLVAGQQQWVEFEDINWDSDDFPFLGDDFAAETNLVRMGRVGQAAAMLMPQRPLIDFGMTWLPRHRK